MTDALEGTLVDAGEDVGGGETGGGGGGGGSGIRERIIEK